jgi:ubiquinone/menaquinone biosynthesis C-methylase UbiE
VEQARGRHLDTAELDTYHKDHWVDIEPERFERYDQLFRVDRSRAGQLLAPVGVEAGEVLVDFGCGPGYITVELARLAGPGGKVHAVDVNADFVARARRVASDNGLAERVSVHHLRDERIPLQGASIDRAYARNVLEYVPDLDQTLGELARVLRPGGTMVASDSDFGFVVVEPLDPVEVTELFEAAAPAFREPYVGRKLPAAFQRAGLTDVSVQVRTSVDRRGHLRGVIENMLGYGLRFGRISAPRADELRRRIDTAIETGEYLAALPQWWVTGRR